MVADLWGGYLPGQVPRAIHGRWQLAVRLVGNLIEVRLAISKEGKMLPRWVGLRIGGGA